MIIIRNFTEISICVWPFSVLRATTIQYFDEATSSYISLGPSENVVEELNSDESSSETNAELNISKVSNDKVKQVCDVILGLSICLFDMCMWVK